MCVSSLVLIVGDSCLLFCLFLVFGGCVLLDLFAGGCLFNSVGCVII